MDPFNIFEERKEDPLGEGNVDTHDEALIDEPDEVVEVEELPQRRPEFRWVVVVSAPYEEAMSFISSLNQPPDGVLPVRWSNKPFRSQIRNGTLEEYYYCCDGGRRNRGGRIVCWAQFKVIHQEEITILINMVNHTHNDPAYQLEASIQSHISDAILADVSSL